MSQETSIGNLNNSISDEDSKLVDSILNDLNSTHENTQEAPRVMGGESGMVQQSGGEQLTPEQIKQIQIQKQQQMMMQQQQLMAQQQMAQKKMNNDLQSKQVNMIQSESIIDNIRLESKNIILVMFLFIIFNLDQVNGMFKVQPSLFLKEDGGINLQAVFVKSMIVGVIYYCVKKYLL
tara:strand:- start:5040 stop:5573 length:534 start_codon:yes stop_codon:yes gene_type:complete